MQQDGTVWIWERLTFTVIFHDDGNYLRRIFFLTIERLLKHKACQ